MKSVVMTNRPVVGVHRVSESNSVKPWRRNLAPIPVFLVCPLYPYLRHSIIVFEINDGDAAVVSNPCTQVRSTYRSIYFRKEHVAGNGIRHIRDPVIAWLQTKVIDCSLPGFAFAGDAEHFVSQQLTLLWLAACESK
jgi:hypothetical protein